MADKETGYVLPLEAASSSEPQSLPGVPGLWTPGEAKAASELGLSVGEMREMVSDLNLPLKEKRVDAPPDDLFERTGGMVSGATGDSAPAEVLTRSASDIPGLSYEEAEARKAEDAARKAEDAAAADAAGLVPVTEVEETTAPEGGEQ